MKTRLIRSAIPIYIAAAVWLLCGLVFPMYKLGFVLLTASLSAAVYLAAGKFFPGRRVEENPVSGDSEIDKEIRGAMEQLRQLKEVNDDIDSPAISEKLDRMEKAGREILLAVSQKTQRAGQVRRFMKYYLPTTSKLLQQYRTLNSVTAKGEHIEKAMRSVENSMDMIAAAFEKQLDLLYRDEAMDISSDVQVLETMMAGDGLTDEGIKQAMKEDQ